MPATIVIAWISLLVPILEAIGLEEGDYQAGFVLAAESEGSVWALSLQIGADGLVSSMSVVSEDDRYEVSVTKEQVTVQHHLKGGPGAPVEADVRVTLPRLKPPKPVRDGQMKGRILTMEGRTIFVAPNKRGIAVWTADGLRPETASLSIWRPTTTQPSTKPTTR